MKTNVVVLGMHRSGTSAVTAAVRDMGLYGGDDADLLLPQHDNRSGFWERHDCMAINDDLLAAAGGSWLNPAQFSTRAIPIDQRNQLEARAQGVLATLATTPGSWVLKDPRFCITAGFWRDSFGAVLYVPVVRDPMSIARSLQARDDLPVDFGLALWEVYTRAMLRQLGDQACVPVLHSRLAERPEQTLSELHGALRDCSVAVIEPLDLGSVRSRWRADYVHQQATRPELESELSTSQLELYDYVSQLTNDAVIRSDSLQDSPASLRILERYGDALSKAHADRLELTELRSSAAELKKVRAVYQQLHDSNAQLGQAHRAEVERHRALETTVAALKERLTFLQAKLLEESHTKREAERGLAEFKAVRGATMPPTSRLSTLWLLLEFIRRNPRFLLRGVNRRRLRRLRTVFVEGHTSAVGAWLRERLSARSLRVEQPLLVPTVDTTERLEFPIASDPAVSIIVPVHNKYRTTLSCLKSILAHTETGYELLVADDCSEDDTVTIAQRVSGIVHVKTRENVGFLANCNHAAACAKGEYLVFLNNDTNVQPGWLAALLQVFEEHPNVGVVGPKLLFEDGRLQEAGGIVWKDGSAWNFGRGQDPTAPEYNYVREVDYVSGACLATRATLWRKISGFDSTFAPAYYEDADYCFSVRHAGCRVLYQPHSVVVHKEGVSHGVDLGQGVKAHQSRNQGVFREKWATELATFHFDNGEHVFFGRDRSRGRVTVLVIDHYVPFYDQDAGSRSVYQYLQHMVRRGLNVKFVGANFFPHQPYTRTLQNLGVEVLVGPEFAASWQDWLRENAQYLDVVCVHRPHIAEQFLADLKQRSPQSRLIYFGVDLHYLRVSREATLKKSTKLAREAEDWKRREHEIFRQVDTICFPSQVEIDEIRKELPNADLRVSPLYVLDDPRPAADYRHADRRDILFVGGFSHPPNEDAILWFCSEVLPKLRTHIADIRLHVVGSHASPVIHALGSSSVLVHGYLPDADLAALYDQVRIVVVPLRFGAGVKGKVLEALNYAVPIVTTPVGAEGLPAATSVMRIAETADDFSTGVGELYRDPAKVKTYLDQYGPYIDRWFGEQAIAAFLEQAVIRRASPRVQEAVSADQSIH